MKLLLYSVIGITVVIGLMLLGLSISSRKQPELGLLDGRLRPCPSTPNCISSEGQGGYAFVEPLAYSATTTDAWQAIKQTVIATGGDIVSEQNTYLHATYATPLLRFIDDVEFRLDENHNVIHIRSASRVGRSDMGMNHKRVARIRTMFEKQIKSLGVAH